MARWYMDNRQCLVSRCGRILAVPFTGHSRNMKKAHPTAATGFSVLYCPSGFAGEGRPDDPVRPLGTFPASEFDAIEARCMIFQTL